MKKEYERYGSEWEKEMMKLPKKILIMMLREEYMKDSMINKREGNQKNPFGLGG